MLLDRLRHALVVHEDIRLKPYHCSAGKLTIGIGRNLDDRGINNDEALFLFNNDLDRTIMEVEDNVPAFPNLTDARQEVLVNMCFNLGLPRFLDFRKMLAAVEACDPEEVARQMLDSRWANQVGRRAVDLAEMYRKG